MQNNKNKVVQIVGTTLLLFTASASFANGATYVPAPCCNHSLFVGVALGIASLNDDTDTVNITKDQNVSDIHGSDSFLGGIHVGIQSVLANNIYLAAVANGLYNSLDDSLRTVTNTVTEKSDSITLENNFQYGANVRVGYQLNNVIPYVFAGVEAGKWETNFPGSNFVNTDSDSKTLVGPQVGVGVTFPLVHNLSAGLEYAHTWFGSYTINVANQVDSRVGSAKQDIQQDQVLATLDYSFYSA